METNLKNIIKSNALVYNFTIEILDIVKYVQIRFFYISTLKKNFYKHLGYSLDLEHPQTFNEKIQWLKCFYRDPIMTQCADKAAVREFVKNIIGERYLVPVYGIYDTVDEINIDELPNEFVLKPTHSSGRVIICQDKKKTNWSNESNKLRKWLGENYYYTNGEWVYKDIKPKIICEKLLSGEMIDYKFMCFHGEPQLLFTCSEREKDLKVTFFDLQFNKLPFIRKYKSSNNVIKPINFEKMIEFSKLLASEFPFVRVDFYENEGKLYFGELTFFPGNGMEWFEPIEWDYKLGKLLDLSKVRKEYLCKN